MTFAVVVILAVACTSDRSELQLGVVRQAVTNPVACVVVGSAVTCPLVVGVQTSYHIEAGQYLRVNNTSGSPVQVDSVRGIPPDPSTWSEMAVGIDGADTQTAPQSPGLGEVGAVDRSPGTSAYPYDLAWDGASTALALAANRWLYVGANAATAANRAHDVLVTASPLTSGAASWRMPRVDKDGFHYCDGTTQASPGYYTYGWRNTTGHDIVVTGAIIYATGGKLTVPGEVDAFVDAAMIGIAAPDAASLRWQLVNSGVNIRGKLDFSDQVVHADEYVIGQASNRCPTGGVWDWAAFLIVRLSPPTPDAGPPDSSTPVLPRTDAAASAGATTADAGPAGVSPRDVASNETGGCSIGPASPMPTSGCGCVMLVAFGAVWMRRARSRYGLASPGRDVHGGRLVLRPRPISSGSRRGRLKT